MTFTYASVFTADKASRDTFALDLLARISCGVGVVFRHRGRSAVLQTAVKRFDLGCPKLKGACAIRFVAAKRHLWRSPWELVDDLAVYGVLRIRKRKNIVKTY